MTAFTAFAGRSLPYTNLMVPWRMSWLLPSFAWVAAAWLTCDSTRRNASAA
jgi:hypothetical protein